MIFIEKKLLQKMHVLFAVTFSLLVFITAISYGYQQSLQDKQSQLANRRTLSPRHKDTSYNTTNATKYSSVVRPRRLRTRHSENISSRQKRDKWMRRHCVNKKPLAYAGIATCPKKINAVTQAGNKCTYVFASSLVFQICTENSLHQRSTYFIRELFPKGPKEVTAAATNSRTGITVLISHRLVYRYLKLNQFQPFCEAKRQVLLLSRAVHFEPIAAFQNVNGRIILMDEHHYVEYNDRRNRVTRRGYVKNFFPNIKPSLAGSVNQISKYVFFYTHSSTIQLFDMVEKHMVQEYPLHLKEYLGCSDGKLKRHY